MVGDGDHGDLSPHRTWWALVLVLAAAGCSVLTAPPSAIEEEIQSAADVTVSAEQAHLRMWALVAPLCAKVVSTADAVAAATDEPRVRRAALVWKIEAVPALREALFRPNPFQALIDTWVLAWQMHDHFATGAGAAELGEGAHTAVEACLGIAETIRSVAVSMTASGDVTRAAEFARAWSREHPIRDSIAGRESTLSRALEIELDEILSTGEAAGEALLTLEDISHRLEVYSAQLPEQSRWQAELLVMELAAEHDLPGSLRRAEEAVAATALLAEDVTTLLPAVAQTLAVAEGFPDLLRSERVAALEGMAAELDAALAFLLEQRVAALQQLTVEREAALLALPTVVAPERRALTTDLEHIGVDLVDHMALRLAQIFAGLFLVGLVGLAALLLVAKRRRPAS